MKKLVILTCLLCALPLWGQTYYRDDGWVQTPLGQAVPGASVAICTQPATTTTQPCSTLASLYAAGTSNSTTLTGASWAGQQIRFIFASVPSDIVANSYFTVSGASPAGYNGTWLVVQVTGTTITVASTANPGTYVSGGAVATSALPNPTATDGNGHYFFYTTPALYTIQIYSGQIAQQVYPDQHINGAPGAGSGTVTSVAATVPSWLSVAGSPIVASGTLAITAATGQTSHLVIGSCGAATTFTPCSLVEADLPATTVFTDQSATFGAHAYDFSGVTLAKLRVSGGLTTSANGDIGYDSTGGNWHAYASSADNILLRTPASSTFTNNDCVKFSLTGSALTAVDAGAPCGSGGGGGSGIVSTGPQYALGQYTTSPTGTTIGPIAAPTTPLSVPSFLVSTPTSGGAAQPFTPTLSTIGLSYIAATGGSCYTLLTTDRSTEKVFTGASSCTVTIPVMSTAGFGAGYTFKAYAFGAGAVVLTPTSTDTINGGASVTLNSGNWATATADGLGNWVATIYNPGSSAGTVTTFSAGNASPLFTTTVTNAGSTPALAFNLATFPPNTMYANCTDSTAVPTATCAIPTGGGGLPQNIFIDPRNPPYNAVGNGIADDTAAFQAAATASGAGGGCIIIPGGVSYLLDRVDVGGGNVCIEGAGNINGQSGTAQGQIIVKTDAAIVNSSNITNYPRGFTLKDVNVYGGSNPVDLATFHQVDIEGVSFYNFTGCGIMHVSGERNVFSDDYFVNTSGVPGFAGLCLADSAHTLFTSSFAPNCGGGVGCFEDRVEMKNLIGEGNIQSNANASFQWLIYVANSLSDTTGYNWTCFQCASVGVADVFNLANSNISTIVPDGTGTSGTPQQYGIYINGCYNSSINSYTPGWTTNYMTQEMHVTLSQNCTIKDSMFHTTKNNTTTFGLYFGFGTGTHTMTLINDIGAVYAGNVSDVFTTSVIGGNIGPTNLPGAQVSDVTNADIFTTMAHDMTGAAADTGTYHLRRTTGVSQGLKDDFYSTGSLFGLNEPITLFGSSSGSATLSVSAVAGTLNLGSTNATVTSAGNLTVAGCTGCTSGGFTNPMTTLGDLISGGAAGSATRLAGPTGPNGIIQYPTETPSGSAAVAPVWRIPGVSVDAQTGTSYPIPITDNAHFITGSNLGATSWAGFALANNYVFSFENLNSGLITYTPNSGTVNGNATQIIPQNWFGFHYTDNTSTFMPVMPTQQAFPSCPDTGGNHLNFTTATGAISCGTSGGGGGSVSGYYCQMSTSTSCTVTVASLTNPGCIASLQSTSTVIASNCAVSGTTATITAASSNSGTWTVIPIGSGVPPSGTTVTKVDDGACNGNSVGSVTCTISAGIALHHRAAVLVYSNQNLSTFISSVTDTASNTYSCFSVYDATSFGKSVAWCNSYLTTAIGAGGSITVTFANSGNGGGMGVYDISTAAVNTNTPDAYGTNTASGAAPVSATTSTSLTATDVVMSSVLFESSAITFSSYGSGYTGLESALGSGVNGYGFAIAVQWKTQASGATATGGITGTGTGISIAAIGANK